MPGGRQAYMPAVNVCCLPRSISSPSRIQTSSQKSWAILSRVSTPAANRSRRVTSPVSGSRARIRCSTPGPPAPPVTEPATGSHARWSGRKNSSSGLGMGAPPRSGDAASIGSAPPDVKPARRVDAAQWPRYSGDGRDEAPARHRPERARRTGARRWRPMPIRITRVYTRTGDHGETALVGGRRVPKDAHRIEAYGTVDELNAVLGLARVFNAERLAETEGHRWLDETLRRLQNQLFDLGSELATPPDADYAGMHRVGQAEVTELEQLIDRCQEELQPLKSFVLPGGGRIGAFLHQARTVCRRAERETLRLSRAEPLPEWPLRYLNRLSDLLFVLSRWVARRLGEPEYLWERGLASHRRGRGPGRVRARLLEPARRLARDDELGHVRLVPVGVVRGQPEPLRRQPR